jgi:hypothetical protein
MNFDRLVRLTIGFVGITLPLVAFFLAQMAPSAARTAHAEQARQPGGEGQYELSVAQPVTPTNTPTNTPVNTPTHTPTQTGTPTETPTASLTPSQTPVASPIYVDQYEPNDSLGEAYETAPGLVLPLNTLWPQGDVDYFRFHAKAGSAYEVLTSDLDAGLDTSLTVYDSNGNVIGTNDDATALSRASLVTFSAGVTGFYFASVTNLSPGNPADQTYSFEVKEILGTATPTPVPSADECEPNGSFQSACLILLDTTYEMDFVPPFGGNGRDNDFYRVWVKDGLYYTCETLNLSSVNDTNMILYAGPGEEYGIAGNDDKDRLGGDLGSQVSMQANYTGWLYVLVGPGPNMEPDYGQSHLYTYDLECTNVLATPTPPATATKVYHPPPDGNGGVATATPFTLPPTATPFEFPTSPPPTEPAQISIRPLPTATPAADREQELAVDVTIYYDANRNSMPELTEGIMDIAVGLYDNATGQLLSFGYTNEAGSVRFGPLVVTGAVRLAVPHFNYSEVVSENTAIQLRVNPRPLPGGIP